MKNITDIFGRFWDAIEVQDNKRMSLHTLPDGIEEIDNIAYINDGKNEHLLDLYYPVDADAPLPVIIDIHGGGWMYGTKELNKHYCLYLAARGYAVFNLDYRLVPGVTVFDQLKDIGAAFNWIDENIGSYPMCDSERIFLTGDSAGGQLAAFSALIQGSETLQDIFDVDGCKLSFKAVGLTSPVPFMKPDGAMTFMNLYFKEMLGDCSGKKYAGYLNFSDLLAVSTLPPTYLVTSSGDYLARAQTRLTYKAIESKGGIRAKLMDWNKYHGKHLPHVFSVLEPASPEGIRAISDMLEFFNSAL